MKYERQRSYIVLQGRRDRYARDKQPLWLACWWNNIGRSLTNMGLTLQTWGMRAGKTVPRRVLEWMGLGLPEEWGAEPGLRWAEERLSGRLCGHLVKSRSWRNVHPNCSLFHGIFLWDGSTSNSVGIGHRSLCLWNGWVSNLSSFSTYSGATNNLARHGGAVTGECSCF